MDVSLEELGVLWTAVVLERVLTWASGGLARSTQRWHSQGMDFEPRCWV